MYYDSYDINYERMSLNMLDTLQPLIKKSITRKYSSATTILYQGEVPRSACVIASGIVRVFTISSQGDEQILTFHVAGEIFPSSWIYNKSVGSMFFYEAVTDCKIALVPRQELKDYMLSSPLKQRVLVNYYATNFAAALLHINALEQPKAREKLLYTLYYLSQRFGKASRNSIVRIPLKLTHQNIASLVGLTRETTATEISKLKKQKILSYTSQKYTIKTDRLLDLIGEDSFRGIKIGA